VGKGKRADVYLEVRKRSGGGKYFSKETSACIIYRLMHALFHIRAVIIPRDWYRSRYNSPDMEKGMH
jgi:hypothetical protein